MISERLRRRGAGLQVRYAWWLRLTSLVAGVVDLILGHRLKGWMLRSYAETGCYDKVHVLEFQHAGYIAESAWYGRRPPAPIIATNWGSDIFWFQRVERHRERMARLLSMASFYSAECLRDWALARELGFSGEYLPVIPNAGGFTREVLDAAAYTSLPSTRRCVAVKGYDRFVGLADRALDAVELAADALRGYEVVVYSASWRIRRRVRRLAASTNLQIRALGPYGMSHGEMLALFGRSRVYIGLSQSDGISTSLLEAITQGCFPIQTDTSCADEWVAGGETGFLIHDVSSEVVAAALRQALADDELVDRAAASNYAVARERLDAASIREVAWSYYRFDRQVRDEQ